MLPHYRTKKAIRLEYTQDACLSASLTGVTLLKSHQLQSRFSGSRKFTIDRRGCMIQKQKSTVRKKASTAEPKKQQYQVNRRRVIQLLTNFTNAQKGKKQLFFYTISFNPSMTVPVAYKCLNSWLTSLRQAFGLKNYLWVAEYQRNGTIHFHLAIKEFLPITAVNNLMKKLLHYYIRNGELKWNHYACSKYNGVHIAKDANSKKVTNFAGNGKAKALAGYLAKYIGKGKETFERQAWQASKSLTNMFTKYNLTYGEFEDHFMYQIDVENPLIESDFYLFYRWIKAPPPEIVYMLKLVNESALQ